MGIELSQKEKRTVLAVFEELLKMSYSELNGFLGSVTIKEMQALHGKLKYETYCEAKGICYEDMTEEDFVDAYMLN